MLFSRVVNNTISGNPSAEQSLIDFESIPGATLAEGVQISDQFKTSHGVSFRFSDGTYPVLAQVGDQGVKDAQGNSEPGAFYRNGNLSADFDTPAAGQSTGLVLPDG